MVLTDLRAASAASTDENAAAATTLTSDLDSIVRCRLDRRALS